MIWRTDSDVEASSSWRRWWRGTAFKMNGKQFTPKCNFFKRQISIFPSVVNHTHLRKRQYSSLTEIMKNAFLIYRHSCNRIKRPDRLRRSDAYGPGSMTSFSEKSPFCNADALKTTRKFVVDAASRTTAWCGMQYPDVRVLAPFQSHQALDILSRARSRTIPSCSSSLVLSEVTPLTKRPDVCCPLDDPVLAKANRLRTYRRISSVERPEGCHERAVPPFTKAIRFCFAHMPPCPRSPR